MGDFDFVMIICTPNQVTAANAGWRSQFRFRGSSHPPGVAEFVERTFYEASKAGRRCRKVGKKMRQHYKGIGSKYYDMVTEQIDVTVCAVEILLNEDAG